MIVHKLDCKWPGHEIVSAGQGMYILVGVREPKMHSVFERGSASGTEFAPKTGSSCVKKKIKLQATTHKFKRNHHYKLPADDVILCWMVTR